MRERRGVLQPGVGASPARPTTKRGAAEEKPEPYAQHGGTTYAVRLASATSTTPTSRSAATSSAICCSCKCARLPRLALRHGARLPRPVDRPLQPRTTPTFSVGEYDWDAPRRAARLGLAHRHRRAGGPRRPSSSVFDFTTLFTLKGNKGDYAALYGFGNGIGHGRRHHRRPPWKQPRGHLPGEPRHRLPHQRGRHAAGGPRVRQLRRTTGRSSRPTPTS